MTLGSVDCCQCGAPITIVADQRYCKCEHCGCKLFIARTDSGAPKLESFESVLKEPLDKDSLKVAKRRLAALEGEIVSAGQQVDGTGRELEAATSAHRQLMEECQKLVSPVQNWTYASGLMGLVSWFLGLFALQDREQRLGFVVAVLVSLVARGFRLEWKDADSQAKARLRESREALQQAETARKEALALWDSRYLERELVQRAVLRYEGSGAAAVGET